MVVESSIFSLFPDINDLEKVHTKYNQHTIDSLRKLLSAYEKGMGKNYGKLHNTLSSLKPNGKLNPYFFYLKLKIAESLKNNDVKNSTNYINELKKALTNSKRSDDLAVKNIFDSSWDEDLFETRFSIDMDRTMGVRGRIKKLTSKEIIIQKEKISDALNLISEVDPVYSSEIDELLSNIHLLKPEKKNQQLFYGASANVIFGSIYFQIPTESVDPIVYYFEHIIHEATHLTLFLLFSEDKLILNDNQKIYTAPLREDKRHMYGIVHATFVLGRLVQAFQKLIDNQKVKMAKKQIKELKKTHELRKLQFLIGYKTIKKYGKLTSNGKKLLNSMSSLAREIEKEQKND